MHGWLIALALGWMAGTAIGLWVGASLWVFAPAVLAAIAAVGGGGRGVVLTLCAMSAVGAAAVHTERVATRAGAGLEPWSGERLVVLRVVEGPRPARRGGVWHAELEAYAGRSGAGAVGPGGWRPLAGRVRVGGWSPLRMPVRGDRVVARATVRRPGEPSHAFDFDGAALDARRGIDGRLELVAEPVWVAPVRRPDRALDVSRLLLERAVLTHVDDREAGVLLALLTGTRGALHREDRRRFADSGAAHVLAVSGLHLGLLTLIVFRTLEALGRRLLPRRAPPSSRQLAALITLPMVAGYVVFTGAPASACRAGIMAGCLLVSAATERRGASLTALALSVVVLLAWRPLWLADLGFQLSVSATASLILAARAGDAPPRSGPVDRRVGALVESLRVSTVATLATAPSLLWTTGRVPWVSPLANLVVVPPLALVALPVGLLGAIATALDVPGGPWLLQVAALSVRVALGLAELYEPVFAQQLVWGRPRGWAWAGWLLLAIASPWLGRATWRSQASVALVAGALLWTGRPEAWRDLDDARIHRVPAGSSEVVWVQLPGPRHVVVGSGPPGFRGPDAMTREVLPYLYGHGVQRVDALVIPSSDRIDRGGVSSAAAALRPRLLVVPPDVARALPDESASGRVVVAPANEAWALRSRGGRVEGALGSGGRLDACVEPMCRPVWSAPQENGLEGGTRGDEGSQMR